MTIRDALAIRGPGKVPRGIRHLASDQQLGDAPQRRDDLNPARGLEGESGTVGRPERPAEVAREVPADRNDIAALELPDKELHRARWARGIGDELPIRGYRRIHFETRIEGHLRPAPESNLGGPMTRQDDGQCCSSQPTTAKTIAALVLTTGPRLATTGRVSAGVVPPLGVTNGSRCTSSSSALCQRSAGRLARQRMMICSSPGAMLGRCTRTDSGVWVTCAARTCWCRGRERRPSSQQLVTHGTHGVDVHSVIKVRVSGRLLGCHVGGRTERHAGRRELLAPGRLAHGLGNAEIHDQSMASR